MGDFVTNASTALAVGNGGVVLHTLSSMSGTELEIPIRNIALGIYLLEVKGANTRIVRSFNIVR